MDLTSLIENVQESWNAKAEEWYVQVGMEGDTNRRFNSDPVLHRMLGDVAGLAVLDAGCGTGYLSLRLAEEGGRVTGVDLSPGMIAVATRLAAERGMTADFRVDSCSQLATIPDGSIDRIVSNYVLMDLPDIEGAIASFQRVLKPGGRAVLIFCHPCFGPPDGGFGRMLDGSTIYRWSRSYFDRYHFEERWGHFTTPFIAFHRPLSHYWKTFVRNGFTILDFDEPVIPDPAPPGADPATIARLRMAPNSVAFLLEKG